MVMPKLTKERILKLRIDEELAQRIKAKANGNMSRYIRNLIMEDLKK